MAPQTAMPEAKHSGTAKNFFLYFLQFALLYTVVFSLGGALFAFINKYVPQPAAVQYYSSFSATALRYYLASLIIASPIFLWLARKIYRDEHNDATMHSSGIRRWLTYLTLIAAALISIGDLIRLVYSLLGGEITMRFTLKALVVLILSGSVFTYFLNDVKASRQASDGQTPSSLMPRIFFIGTSIIIVTVIIAGFFNIDSPMSQRKKKQDDQRINYLQTIQYQVEEYARNMNALPTKLSDLSIREEQTMDPVTKKLFRYETTGATSYRLCATFETSNKEGSMDDTYYYDSSWLHPAGEFCFIRNANTALQKGAPVIDFPQQFAP